MYRLHGVLTRPRREGLDGVIALVPPRRSASVCSSSGRGFSARYGFWRGVHSGGAGWGILRDLVACRWGLTWGRLRVLSRSMHTSGKSRGLSVERFVSGCCCCGCGCCTPTEFAVTSLFMLGEMHRKVVGVYTHERTPYARLSDKKSAYYHSV